MTPQEMRDALAELAREAGLDVRVATGPRDVEPGIPVQSGVCRVRDKLWVILAAGDSFEDHIQTLVDALRAHAGAALESRYLPPAVRARLDGAG